MNSGVFKTIILGLVLVVFSFVLGSQVTESRESALMLLAVFCGCFLLLVLGKRCWWLLFVVMPLPALLPLPAIASYMPIAYETAAIVLPYWLIMWAMGYVRIRWRGMWLLDVATFLFFAYLLLSYYRHPVGVNVLSQLFATEAPETMGGKAYFLAIFAVLYYVALSVIPFSREELRKALKLTYLLIALGLLIAMPGRVSDTYSMVATARVGRLQPVGWFMLHSLLCAYPLSAIVSSAWRFVGLILGFAFVSLTGYRSVLAYEVFLLAFLSAARRQIGCVLLLGSCSLACVYWASSEKLLLNLPAGTQRVLAVLPGIEIDATIEADATHSSDWRYVMWRWALDPRTGYIRDYVWGDGLGINVYEMQLMEVQQARGKVAAGDQRIYAAQGVWHSGIIDAIHRLGFVGLGVISLCWFAGLYAFFRMFASSCGTSIGFYLAYFSCPLVTVALGYYTAAGSTPTVVSAISYIALIKVGWCILREEGMIQPLFQRKIYVPLAIREHEAAVVQNPLQPAS